MHHDDGGKSDQGSKAAMFTSETDEWGTPARFFRRCEEQIGKWKDSGAIFTLDPCATPENAKCDTFLTLKDDGLSHDWSGHSVWMNPPYGPGIGDWVRKAWLTVASGESRVMGLLPARTDTAWWHEFVMRATWVRFVRGRLSFGDEVNPAPFPSALALWSRPDQWHGAHEPPVLGAISAKPKGDETMELFDYEPEKLS